VDNFWTVYGMNFEHMPELHWVFGYPFAIGLMGIVCVSLYVIFKRRDWLWSQAVAPQATRAAPLTRSWTVTSMGHLVGQATTNRGLTTQPGNVPGHSISRC
jgi:hypothetical protein